MFCTVIYSLILVLTPAVFAQTDYCSSSLCAEGKKHIACGNNGEFASICQSPQIIPMTAALQTLIVDKHNSLRNNIASGSISPFPSAARMATMVWDDILAKLAELNVKQCQMEHDECRNTEQFPHAGQNLFERYWTGWDANVTEDIENNISDWFNEYIDCPLDVIKSYRSSSSGIQYGHFTAIVQERSTHVGCAMSQHIKDGYDCSNFACNYAMTNMYGDPVYTQRTNGLQCTTGTNDRFTSLCSTQENYSYN